MLCRFTVGVAIILLLLLLLLFFVAAGAAAVAVAAAQIQTDQLVDMQQSCLERYMESLEGVALLLRMTGGTSGCNLCCTLLVASLRLCKAQLGAKRTTSQQQV
eukprot:5076410-Amphidinium_carterae.2